MQPTNPRPIRRYIILGFIALVVLYLVYFIFTHGVAKVTFTDEVQKQTQGTYYIRHQDDPQRTIKTLEFPSTKTHYLRSGLYEVFISNGREETVGYLRVGSFMRSSQLSLTTTRQAASAKIGSESFGCSFAQGGVVYSYECTLPANVHRHIPINGSRLSSRVPINDLYYQSIAPYRSGILTTRLQDEDQLESSLVDYLDLATNQTTPIPLPTDDRFESVDELISDASNPDSQAFALRSGNTIYTYTATGAAANGAIELPKEYAEANLDRDISIVGDDIWVYFGLRNSGPDTRAESQSQDAFKGGVALHYSATNAKEIERITLPKQLRAYGMRSTENGLLFIDDLLYEYYERNGNKLGKLLAQNDEVSQVQRTGANDFLFVKDSRLFRFDAKTVRSSLLFESGRLNLSSVTISGRSYVVSAFVAQDPDQNLHIYQIDPNAAPEFPRKEWSLPFITGDGPVLQMDYDDAVKQAVIILSIDSLEFSASAPPIFNQQEFDTKRQEALDLLAKRGVKFDGYNLTFREF